MNIKINSIPNQLFEVDLRLTKVERVDDQGDRYKCTVYFWDKTNDLAGRIESILAHGATLPLEVPESAVNMYLDGVYEPISPEEFALL